MTVPPPRRSTVDRLLSGSAGIVAACALAVSVYQAYTARQQQKLSAWPYLAVGNTSAGGYAKIVQNAGLGPALVRSMIVEVDGRPQHRWREVARRVLRADSARFAVMAPPTDTGVYTSTLGRGVVLLPGATLELFHAPPGRLAALYRTALNDPRVRLQVCYCSLYDDCWTVAGGRSEPAPARSCPSDPAREFGD